MTRGIRLAALAALALATAMGGGPARAQAEPPAGNRRAIVERMRGLFAARLKADVGLDDAQIAVVLPKIEALERERGRIQRERGATLRGLRQGLETGAPDGDLQARLDRLDALAADLERANSGALHDIDASLTVPQRVRIRFLLVRFRAEMAQRIRELRRGGARP